MIEKGDFVLMDYGAGYCDYRSDMTRTVVMGEPTQEQLDLYALVRRTHEECVAAIHPGVEGNDIFKLSKKIIGDAGYGDRYNHGLGHGVGIDIHELPNFNRSKNIIEVGSVITMEPGVYLPGVGGVRLEDYGVVTENGYEPSPRPRTTCILSIAKPSIWVFGGGRPDRFGRPAFSFYALAAAAVCKCIISLVCNLDVCASSQ